MQISADETVVLATECSNEDVRCSQSGDIEKKKLWTCGVKTHVVFVGGGWRHRLL